METSLLYKPDTLRLRDSIREWGLEYIRPHARSVDKTEILPENVADIFAACPLQQSALNIATNGLLENDAYYGGDVDDNFLLAAVACEAVFAGDPWAYEIFPGNNVTFKVIEAIATDEQKEKWLSPKGMESLGSGSFALTEPHFGSDPSQVATTARREGDTWVLNGSKMYCSGGADAGHLIVFATVDKSLGNAGIRAFLMEREKTPGFIVVKENEDKLGVRNWKTSSLSFEDAAVPAENMLGDPEGPARGLFGALSMLNDSRPLVSSFALGIGVASLSYFEDWYRNNQQYYSKLDRMRIEDDIRSMNHVISSARRLIYRCCRLKDEALPNRLESSVAKAAAPQAAELVCRRVIELMGPEGSSEEHLVEKWYRDVKIFDIFEGSGQIHRVIMSREIFGTR